MRRHFCSKGNYVWDACHHCRFLHIQLFSDFFLTVLATLFWRYGILPIQARTNVPAGKVQAISSRSKITDVLRGRHPHSNCYDYHQCLRVHQQFQQGIEAAYQQAKTAQRRREDN